MTAKSPLTALENPLTDLLPNPLPNNVKIVIDAAKLSELAASQTPIPTITLTWRSESPLEP